MSEIKDIIVPILQRLQNDIADIKRTLAQHGQKLDAHTQMLEAHTQKFEELEIYTAYETGLGTQNKADLQAIRKTIKAMEERLSRLETPA